MQSYDLPITQTTLSNTLYYLYTFCLFSSCVEKIGRFNVTLGVSINVTLGDFLRFKLTPAKLSYQLHNKFYFYYLPVLYTNTFIVKWQKLNYICCVHFQNINKCSVKLYYTILTGFISIYLFILFGLLLSNKHLPIHFHLNSLDAYCCRNSVALRCNYFTVVFYSCFFIVNTKEFAASERILTEYPILYT